MKPQTLTLAGVLLAALTGENFCAQAADYFVTKEGRDANAGTTRAAAFATIQHGVSALRPGDTLTIGPGEYHEAVKRIDLGSTNRDTVTPGTAIFVEDLLIKNCVNTYKFGGMHFWRCPNLLIPNTVFAAPMIMAFVHRNAKSSSRSKREPIVYTSATTQLNPPVHQS